MSFPNLDQNYKQYEVKEGIVFLIELTDSLFKPLATLDDHSQLQEILLCIDELMSDMIVSFYKNGVGIYFYNSEETGSKFPKKSGLTKIFSLNDLNSSNMKTLSNIVRDEADGFKPLTKRYRPRAEPLDNLQTVLRMILREFQQKPQYNRTKLIWFTNNDKPYLNPEAKDSLRTIISDFEDNNIFIEPIFLDSYLDEAQTKRKEFETSLFENIFLNTNFLNRVLRETRHAEEQNSGSDSFDAINKIKTSIARLKEVRRIQISCDLILSDGPGIGGALGCSIKGYTLFDHEKIKASKNVYTEGEALKVVQIDSSSIRSDTQAEVEIERDNDGKQKKIDAVKGLALKYTNKVDELKENESNERVLLLPENVLQDMKSYSFDHVPQFYQNAKDLSQLEVSSEPGQLEEVSFSKVPYLKLLCFRQLNSFQPFFNLKPALFVTADLDDGLGSGNREGGFANSRTTFTSLYQSCVKLKRFAMVFGCAKLNSTPTLYALYPTNTDGSNSGNAVELPDGFLLVSLPWLGEIRSLPEYVLTEQSKYFFEDPARCAPLQLVEAFKKVIGLVGTSEYNPESHSNPVLQYFYKTIKQEALQMDIKDEDQTVEGNDWSSKELLQLKTLFTEDRALGELVLSINSMLDAIGAAEGSKRAAEDSDIQNGKKQKARPLNEADVITLWKNDTWGNVTVAQLREFIKRYDSIKSATKKADMIANISNFLESKQKTK
ncbi:hypothetical protein PUMCH_002042 [Australozyma saopauloensis]|uniref:ATP-dependent DNA helicase II subunit 1 n=1 Tax=Australozyma saopauloensis TaxID=291208 RepID=A0AAX4H8D8_9ASCO|nr:hypothetical protein PUMCH_002042 [[Candida] saopauloensis]